MNDGSGARRAVPAAKAEGPLWVDSGGSTALPRMAGIGASSALPRAPAKVRSQTDLPTLALARQPFLGQGLSVIAASR